MNFFCSTDSEPIPVVLNDSFLAIFCTIVVLMALQTAAVFIVVIAVARKYLKKPAARGDIAVEEEPHYDVAEPQQRKKKKDVMQFQRNDSYGIPELACKTS